MFLFKKAPKLLRTARHYHQHTARRMHLMPFVYSVQGKQDGPATSWANHHCRLLEERRSCLRHARHMRIAPTFVERTYEKGR